MPAQPKAKGTKRPFRQCKSNPNPPYRHHFVYWYDKIDGRKVLMGTHCDYCGKMGKHIHGR